LRVLLMPLAFEPGGQSSLSGPDLSPSSMSLIS
jgi:hypothetical protein